MIAKLRGIADSIYEDSCIIDVNGVGYLVAVFIVDEGRRRLRSKDVPSIFQGLPASLIYIGILSLAIYGLLGHAVTM